MARRPRLPAIATPGDFPDPRLCAGDFPLALGLVLNVPLVLAAYRRGIFPWYSEGEPVLWWSPDPRFLLLPNEFHVPDSLRKEMRKPRWRVTCDTDFSGVIAGCAESPRPGQDGTWITDEIEATYTALHHRGVAHSVEVWCDGKLAGGLYGVSLGRTFFGESMFFRVPEASKVGFASLMPWLTVRGFQLIDCQQETPHLARFGGRCFPRAEFLDRLALATDDTEPGFQAGSWTEGFARFQSGREAGKPFEKEAT